MGTLNCSSCGTILVQNEDLFLYRPVQNECHLAIKFERAVELLNEASVPFFIRPIDPDSDGKSFFVKSATIVCKKCDAVVAFRIHCGPDRDSLICISMKTTYHVLDDGVILSNSTFGGGPKRKKVLEIFLDVRDVTQFYGKKMDLMKSDSSVGTLKHPTLEYLNELEMNSLIMDRPRSYQIECFCAAAMFSSIIQIPTGSGKTLISAMLTSLYKRLNPNRMVWFLTDRIPLVFQQARYIESQTSLTVLPLAGDVQTNLKPSQLIKYDVLVCTVQLLINMLIIGQIRITDVSLVIIDEIHHAVKNHPYVIFIETFLSQRTGNEQPRFLGLTASPAAGSPIQMKLQLKDLCKLCNAQLYTPCIYRNDLANAINRPNTSYIPVSLSLGDSKLFKIIFENIRELLIQESCPCSNLEDLRLNLKGLTVKSRKDPKLAAKLYRVNQLLTALEMTSILGSKYSKDFLVDLLKPLSGVELDERQLTHNESKILEICENEDGEMTISPKAQALCQLLESIDLTNCPDTRMIIFVETKRTARWLASFLQEFLVRKGLNSWNPTAFTGQASNSADGMSWNTEQRPILALFRSGFIKLLIATSVLQEGLDVAACNHIVLFDRTWSLKAFLQSRGRARAQDSEYTIICSADDQLYYEKLFKQEILLSKMVRDEMVDGNVLSLELTMATICLNVKCGKSDFVKYCPNFIESENSFGFTNTTSDESDGEKEESEYYITLNIHNVKNSIDDGPCHLNLIDVERRRDHLIYLSDLEEIFVTVELPEISLKSIKRSWIQLSEELLDPIISERFPGSLLELDRIIPDFIIGNDACFFLPIAMEIQKFAIGILDSDKKFIECASQHHSFTPTLSQIIFNSFSRRINILFQESLDKTYRIEIPYDRIDMFCLVSRNSNSDESNFSLILPLKSAPLLHVTFDDVSKFELEKKIDEINWERVPSNGFNERLSGTFSVCPTIKIDLFLNGMTSRKLFQILSRIGSNILYTCNFETETFPEFNLIWSVKTEKFLNTLDFETQYRLRSVISETWSKTSMRLSLEWLELAALASDGILLLFVKKLSANRFIDPLDCLKSCFEHSNVYIKSQKEHIHGALPVKLVTWTPSRIFYHPATIFISNRVLREFGPHHFIRVHFRDEDFLKISSIRNNSSIDKLLDIGVRECLDNGIVIGDKKFEFLAMSSSQLRGHGCWFISDQIGADNVRAWLGTFDEISNIAKYVARLGQSFSASKPTLTIASYQEIPDWENDEYVFSDGCGIISPKLAENIASTLNLKEIPSAFQIRFGGFKGVVSVNPEADGLALRKSMKKFGSDRNSLDVLNIAQAFPCFLNRQIIMILSALGVPDSSFETLQLNHLKYLAECFNTSRKIFLQNLNVSDLDPADPFLRSLIFSQYHQQLTDLLTKTRVSVSMGRILMGVIDETGTMAEDEVFCQIQDDYLNSVIDRKVIIAKNPCMHPGDVRVLKAVRNSLLEPYSKNVIVFSRHGSRPVPNMCSGSDLDGDLYFVSWDPTLIPPKVDEPMTYDSLKAQVKDGPITVDDLKSFMVFFIKNDRLGSIANTHVAFADQYIEGVRDPACMALAKIFSYAVDFPKTGYVPNIPKEVRIDKYPDFMQKYDKPVYASHRIIGKLFREIKAIMNEEILEYSCDSISIDKEQLTPGYEEYVEIAGKLYNEYAMDIAQCLNQYGFKMESDLLMTCSSAIDINIREMNSDALEIAELTYKHHVDRYHEILDSLIAGKDDECRSKLASACYFVTYSNPLTPIGLVAPILSFPWIINNRNEKIDKSSNSLVDLIAQNMKDWFLSPNEKAVSETTTLIDTLSQKMFLLNQIEGILNYSNGSKLNFCLKEFLLTGQIILLYPAIDQASGKIRKCFPAAVIKESSGDSLSVSIEGTNILIQKELISERSFEFSSQMEYIKSYLSLQISPEYPIDLNFKFSELDVCEEFSIGPSVLIEEIPKALRNWMNWVSNVKYTDAFKELSRRLIDSLDETMKSLEESEPRIHLLRIQHCLMRTCSIETTLKLIKSFKLGEMGNSKSSIIKSIVINSKTSRKPSVISPTGKGCYVQGASKIIFMGSGGESDLLRFDVYEGERQIHHLTKICYKISLKTSQNLLGVEDSFVFNEFWAHLNRQFLYLRRFGGPEYGKLHVSVKLGRVYATELPRIFMDQPVSKWLADIALEKSFKSNKRGHKKKINDSKKDNNEQLNFEDVNFDSLKHNPKIDSCIDETISSSRVTQSLQTLLETIQKDGVSSSDPSEATSTLSAPAKKSKSFGNMSTAFETVVSEEIALKFLKMGQFTVENTLHVSLSCYDESINANKSISIHYNNKNELISFGQRALRWAVVDLVSEKSNDLRISVNSCNSRLTSTTSSIFSNGIIERFENDKMFKVKPEFKSNPTIYARFQEGHSAVLREDFILIVRKIVEAAGVDPISGEFALKQEKWEIEVKMDLDWDEIHDFQYREQLILTLWEISRKLK